MREGDRTIDHVVDAVAAHYEITREEVLAGRPNLRARHVAKHVACRVTKQSLGQIGARFGHVSTTNILHAFRVIERDMRNDAHFAAEVDAIKASLLAR